MNSSSVIASSNQSLPSSASGQVASWQQHLKEGFRDLDALLAELNLSRSDCGASNEAAQQFAVRVPRPFVARMQYGNPNDPLLRQVLATVDELIEHRGFSTDPLEELSANPVPGLVHKYHGRALLMPTSACAVNCRYCFRRHFPYENNRLNSDALDKVIDYFAGDPTLSEVILSGGDPLLLDDSQLHKLIARLETVPHLKRLRIHSRTPVVIPDRLTEKLAKLLSASRLTPVLVIHCNHPNEVDLELSQNLASFRAKGIALLNQTVLLKGINDSANVLAELNEKLFEAGTLPYYLHQLDRVQGAAHFAVSDEDAMALHQELRALLPGYLVPELVREVAGKPNKTPL